MLRCHSPLLRRQQPLQRYHRWLLRPQVVQLQQHCHSA
jgi:hypothetical protein